MIENRISDRAKILLIDEDTSISYLIRRAMEKENYKIYIAGSGKQGMEMSTGVCPDLILMDNKFSDMEGITLIQWFREWTDCPIIILSEQSWIAHRSVRLSGHAVRSHNHPEFQ